MLVLLNCFKIGMPLNYPCPKVTFLTHTFRRFYGLAKPGRVRVEGKRQNDQKQLLAPFPPSPILPVLRPAMLQSYWMSKEWSYRCVLLSPSPWICQVSSQRYLTGFVLCSPVLTLVANARGALWRGYTYSLLAGKLIRFPPPLSFRQSVRTSPFWFCFLTNVRRCPINRLTLTL